MKQIQKTVVCAILAIELLMGFCASGAVSFAETPEVPAALPAEVTVSASGTVRLVPDKASVAFGVTTEEASADLAQSKNSEAVDNVIAVLTERGIEEKSIRTTNYSLYPQYDYSDGVSRIIGYSVCTTLLIQDVRHGGLAGQLRPLRQGRGLPIRGDGFRGLPLLHAGRIRDQRHCHRDLCDEITEKAPRTPRGTLRILSGHVPRGVCFMGFQMC